MTSERVFLFQADRAASAGDVELVPPTWVTLRHLHGHGSTTDLLHAVSMREPRFYVTRRISIDPPTVAWHGDAAYDGGDPAVAGPRHRLTMDPSGWHFEEPETG